MGGRQLESHPIRSPRAFSSGELKSKDELKTHTRLISKMPWPSMTTKMNVIAKSYSHF